MLEGVDFLVHAKEGCNFFSNFPDPPPPVLNGDSLSKCEKEPSKTVNVFTSVLIIQFFTPYPPFKSVPHQHLFQSQKLQ